MKGKKLSDNRLHKRYNFTARFEVDAKDYVDIFTVSDISLGGMRLIETSDTAKKDDILNGILTIQSGKLFVTARVLVVVLEQSEAVGTRLKFIDIPEEMIEFLRGSGLRKDDGARVQSDWIEGKKVLASSGARSGFIKFLWAVRIEVLIFLIAILFGFFLFARSASFEIQPLTSRNAIIAPVTGVIDNLLYDQNIHVGDDLATISIVTINQSAFDVSVMSQVAGQNVIWNTNSGDEVIEGEIIGEVQSYIFNGERQQLILRSRNFDFDFAPGDLIYLIDNDGNRIAAEVHQRMIGQFFNSSLENNLPVWQDENVYILSATLPFGALSIEQARLDIVRTLVGFYFGFLYE